MLRTNEHKTALKWSTQGCERLSLPPPLLRISDRWNPAARKRMLSDSGLGKISPHYEVPDKQKDASQTHMLQ